MAFELNLEHRSKHVPFGGAYGDADIVVIGKDWSAAAFVWAFAANDGAASIDITLNAAAAGSQGVSASYDAGYVHPNTGAVVGATTLRPQIDEATLEALTGWPTAPAAREFYHNLLITPSGEPQLVYCYGTLTVYQGVGD